MKTNLQRPIAGELFLNTCFLPLVAPQGRPAEGNASDPLRWLLVMNHYGDTYNTANSYRVYTFCRADLSLADSKAPAKNEKKTVSEFGRAPLRTQGFASLTARQISN